MSSVRYGTRLGDLKNKQPTHTRITREAEEEMIREIEMIRKAEPELDSEDVSEQRASASLPDSVPTESEEERAAREADEMAALDAVGDYEADPNVMLEDVPQDIVIKTLKVSCACVPVLVFACVCVYVRARDVDMCS